MRTFLVIIVIFCVFSCGTARKAASSSDQSNIQGVWLAISETHNNIKRDVSYRYEFRKDKVTFTDETGKVVIYSFKLDTIRNPKLIIIQAEETSTAPVSVGYELNGDQLAIVVAPPGLVPSEISDANNQELIICKREGLK